MAASMTPVKCYSLGNICVVCGFSFLTKSVDDSGNISIKKYLDKKLRLTPERRETLINVCNVPKQTCFPSDSGVCQKCFRAMERVHKLEKEAMDARHRFSSSIRTTMSRYSVTVPSPSKAVVKREMRSPGVLGIEKRFKAPETETSLFIPIRRVTPQKLKSFKKPLQVPQTGCIAVSIAPMTEKPSASVPQPTNTDPCETKMANVKSATTKARKSLKFQKENIPIEPSYSTSHTAEFMVSASYPSGTKTVVVTNKNHQKICKALIRGINVEKVVTDSVCSENKEEVVKHAAKLVQEEAAGLCKRGFPTILQQKKYEDIFQFNWDKLKEEFQMNCPSMSTILSCVVADIPKPVVGKQFHHVMLAAALGLHGRSQEMSLIQYMIGFVLVHGGCTKGDIERLSHIGLSVHPETIHRALVSWENKLDTEIMSIKESWEAGGHKKYQLIGDNWDKNILPSYRTSDRKTESLHLFNMYALVDRVTPERVQVEQPLIDTGLDVLSFIPSIDEQEKLLDELVFIYANSVIKNSPQLESHFKNIYPQHLKHKYSELSGNKTSQYPLGLFDTNENKTNELIQLLKILTKKYVPCKDGKMVEPVFFGGDRLTDERVQGAQNAMKNAETYLERLEGFISKTEDFHRLMNFLEAIHKLTYSTDSGSDTCTVFHFRTLLNMKNVKGEVKNSYRPYKLLYYTLLDAICLVMLYNHFDMQDNEDIIPFPENFDVFTNLEKINWLNEVSSVIIKRYFFNDDSDLLSCVRNILLDPDHPENYWTTNVEDDRTKCHHCEKSYARIASLKAHESKVHNVKIEKQKAKGKDKSQDEVRNYVLLLFRLVLLHKNLDSAVDMGDGERSVRSAKYELPIYNKTHKTKYVIGSIHLTALTSGVLPPDQCERLIANRFVNLQGGKNNNLACDEYIEMMNRDSKNMCKGNQTKESIIKHSKEYPILINFANHFDAINDARVRKGFHHLPSYRDDVVKVVKVLMTNKVLVDTPGRVLKCRTLNTDVNPFQDSVNGLSTMIHRHKPSAPFRRLRSDHI